MILPTQPTPPTISQAHKEIDKKMYKFFLVASLKTEGVFWTCLQIFCPSPIIIIIYCSSQIIKNLLSIGFNLLRIKISFFQKKKFKKWQRVSVWYNLFVCSKNWNESKKKNRQKKKTLSIKMKKKKNNSKMQKGKNICFFFQFFTSWKLLCYREKRCRFDEKQ